MTLQIGLPMVQSPEKFVHLCYDVSGLVNWYMFHRNVPDMTLRLLFGATVTLRLENMFVAVQDGLKCLAILPMTEERPLAILGNIAQQNMHISYDLDKWTVTFAPADCARSYNLMTHKYRRCIVLVSINKSVEPNKEQKVLTSGFDQGFTVNTSKRVFKGIW
jgi:hypothetical protein